MPYSTYLHAVEVYGVAGARVNRHAYSGELRVPPREVVVEVDDQGAQTATAAEVIERFHVVRVQLEVPLRLVLRHLQ